LNLKSNKNIHRWLIAAGLSSTIALSGGIVSYFEGKSNTAYLDPVNIWTICYGETRGVSEGDFKTDEECLQSLSEELQVHHQQMVRYIKIPITEKEEAAYLSFTYNVGDGAFRRSTLLRKLNEGDRVGACNELLRWNKAGGKVLRGLTLRRETERTLCLEGVAEYEKARKELEE
tara:strand:- start:48222 stop:48743 length:522 start_codon:yes stop_codon:yes gene_type:complete